ncbi:MAG: YfiR family protein [Candidatus Thiodiazotropha sp. (ex Semelilucina semeliformis)]|nr:YfiR family protein [Candidatus Thiodiazotropha sp. (ex Myrtea spinifera)]MCU7807822.1 YfiR family protein [Candidatus Thiodiazotropha sp. (ex Semelilucina semeliformis)]MCU7830215.1 YfiR family protein [Candidatus Thiodiazotropha sp. (ex Myrtea sp. 'scaly one' KF741663)]
MIRPFVLLALLFYLPVDTALSETAAEHELKAVFLYNFANYIAWPDKSFQTKDSPFNYCLLGESSINTSLKAVVANEMIKGRKVQVLELMDKSRLSACHILFIHQEEDGYPAEIMQKLATESVLTVSDDSSFIPSGGTICLLQKKRKIDLLISMDAIEQGELKVSSKLLRLAKRIPPDREMPGQ